MILDRSAHWLPNRGMQEASVDHVDGMEKAPDVKVPLLNPVIGVDWMFYTCHLDSPPAFFGDPESWCNFWSHFSFQC